MKTDFYYPDCCMEKEGDFEKLSRICRENVRCKFGDDFPKILNSRLKDELEMIQKQESSHLYLWLYEFIKENKFPKTSYYLRGSGASMLVCYLLDISHENPMDELHPFYPELFTGIHGERKPYFELCLPAPLGFEKRIGGERPEIHLLGNQTCLLNSLLFEETKVLPKEEDLKNPLLISSLVKEESHRIGVNLEALGVGGIFGGPMRDFLSELAPKTFEELIKVFCLCSGTGVWKENGEILFQNGAPLSDLISSREDVFETLFSHGMERMAALETADAIGRGKKIPDLSKRISSTDLPNEIRESLGKIRYLFPRCHGAQWMRIGLAHFFYKVNYPEIYDRVCCVEPDEQ